MSTLAFDTRRFVKNLTSKGMKPELADALGDEMTELMTGRLVTKDDIVDMATKTDLEHLKESVSKDIEIIATKISNRLLGILVALVFVMAGVLFAANFAMLQFILP